MFAFVALNFTVARAPVATSYDRTQPRCISSTNIELRWEADNDKYQLYKAYARTYGLYPHKQYIIERVFLVSMGPYNSLREERLGRGRWNSA